MVWATMCASKSGWRACCSQPTSRVGSVRVLRVKGKEALGRSGVSLSSAAQASECERFGEDQGTSPNWASACRHHLPCGNPVPNLMKQLRWRWQQVQAERLLSIFTALGDALSHLPLLFSALDVLAAHLGLLAATGRLWLAVHFNMGMACCRKPEHSRRELHAGPQKGQHSLRYRLGRAACT